MIQFDPATRRIILDSASVTATELYSRSCDWLASGDNAKYGAVFRQVGGDDLGGGLSIPPYFFLQGAWRIRPMELNHTLTLTGNLFVDGGGDPVVPALGAFNVLVKSVVPVQAQGISTSGATAPTAAENAQAVWAHSSAVGITVKLAEAWGRLGLDASKPLVTGDTSITFGDIAMALTESGTNVTLTRQ